MQEGLGPQLACCNLVMRNSVQPSSTPVTLATLPLQAGRSRLPTTHAAEPMLNAAVIPASGGFQRVFDQAAAADSSLGKDSGVSGSKASPSGYGSADILAPKGSTYNPVMEQMLTQLAAAPRFQDPVVGVPGRPEINQRPTAPWNKSSSTELPDGKTRSRLTDVTQPAALLASPAATLTHSKSLQRAAPSTLNSAPSTAKSSDASVDFQIATTSPLAVHNLKLPVDRLRHAEGSTDLEAGAVSPTSEQPLGLNTSLMSITTTAVIPTGFSLSETIALVPVSDEPSQLKSLVNRSGQARQAMNKLDSNASRSEENVASLVVDSSSRGTNQFAPAHVEASSAPSHPHATHPIDLRQSDLQLMKADTGAVSSPPGAGHPVERTRSPLLLSPTSADPHSRVPSRDVWK